MSKKYGFRIYTYQQADYLSRKHFYVHIHELPDFKRWEIIQHAKKQIKEMANTI